MADLLFVFNALQDEDMVKGQLGIIVTNDIKYL